MSDKPRDQSGGIPIDARSLVDIMQNTPLDQSKITDAADWIEGAPDERERSRRWDVIESLAGIWAGRVRGLVRAELAQRLAERFVRQ